MGRNIVKAKLDIIFKTMFSKSENEDILHSFLSIMLTNVAFLISHSPLQAVHYGFEVPLPACR